MKLLYISGPIKASTESLEQANIDYACYRASFYWQKGYSVICPHANSRNVKPYIKSGFDWMPGDLEQVKRCDTICLLKGWENSKGSKRELEVALRCGLSIIVDEEETVKISVQNNLDFDGIKQIEEIATQNSLIYLEQVG